MSSLRNKTVLVVDDDAGLLRALSKVLTSEGANVTAAVWGGEAVDHLETRNGQFDLVITDLRMPVVNGSNILTAVKSAFPRVPVIVITALGSPDVRSKCLALGATAFLEKPLEAGTLLAAAQAALDGQPQG
jgi:CheY-like chemotaxis protein